MASAPGGTLVITADSQHKVQLEAKLTNIRSSWILTPTPTPLLPQLQNKVQMFLDPQFSELYPHPYGKAQDKLLFNRCAAHPLALYSGMRAQTSELSSIWLPLHILSTGSE